MSRWCLGLREKAKGELSREQLLMLIGHRKRSLIKAWLYLFGAPIVLAAICLPAMVIGVQLESDPALFAGLTFAIGLLLILPLAILLSKDKFSVAANAKKDLNDKSFTVFQGRYDQRLQDDPIIKTFQKKKRLNFEKNSELNLVLSNGSSTLISVNDTNVLDLSLKVHVADVVEPPEFADLAAQYLKPTESAGMFVHQRSLTDEEKDELIRHKRKVLGPGMFLWTGFVLSVAILSLFSIRANPNKEFIHLARFLIFLGLSAIALFRLVKLIQLRHRINRDLEDGFVFIERHSLDSTEPEKLSETVEILPHSHLLWLENKQPASWRSL